MTKIEDKDFSQCNDCFDGDHCKGKVKECQCKCVPDREKRMMPNKIEDKIRKEFYEECCFLDDDGGCFFTCTPKTVEYFLLKALKQAKQERDRELVEMLEENWPEEECCQIEMNKVYVKLKKEDE